MEAPPPPPSPPSSSPHRDDDEQPTSEDVEECDGDGDEWNDDEAVYMSDGPTPVAVIQFTDEFKRARARLCYVYHQKEYSERAMRLTTEVIEINPADYTAWYVRRRCLEELKRKELFGCELDFTDKQIASTPKCYQVWHHRRWLMETATSENSLWGSSMLDDDELRDNELKFTSRVLLNDPKNFNVWSHRKWIFTHLLQPLNSIAAIRDECVFSREWIDDDVRNNSAWNYRSWPFKVLLSMVSDAERKSLAVDEINYIFLMLHKAPTNGSVWNYLIGLLGDPFYPPLSPPSEEERIRKSQGPQWSDTVFFITQRIKLDPLNRWALTAYVFALVSMGELQSSIQLMKLIAEGEPRKAGLWNFRIHIVETMIKRNASRGL